VHASKRANRCTLSSLSSTDGKAHRVFTILDALSDKSGIRQEMTLKSLVNSALGGVAVIVLCDVCGLKLMQVRLTTKGNRASGLV
jgi:hypothetical protein